MREEIAVIDFNDSPLSQALAAEILRQLRQRGELRAVNVLASDEPALRTIERGFQQSVAREKRCR